MLFTIIHFTRAEVISAEDLGIYLNPLCKRKEAPKGFLLVH